MDRWIGKIAIVTGASSGIGAQITVDLANLGVHVIGLARRVELVMELESKITESGIAAGGSISSYQCDVSIESDIETAFNWVIDIFGGVDILINNAGIGHDTTLLTIDNAVEIRQVLHTNVLGVVFCTREAFQSMKSRGVDGHIILINSVLGHTVPAAIGGRSNIYAPSKFAITAMTEVLRQELLAENTKIKITSISPGAVNTNLLTDDARKALDGVWLEAEDISAAVQYVLGTPPRVQIHELIIKPIGEKF